jgi:regulator of protease activity HflC (stomatin/prohibitin superfamily)
MRKNFLRHSFPGRILLISVLAFLTFFSSACRVVQDGEAGLSKSFGKIADEVLLPGAYFFVPAAREIEIWDIKTQKKILQPQIPDQDGLMLRLEAAVLFRADDVVHLRRKVGPRYYESLLMPVVTDSFREVVGSSRVEDIIKSPEKLRLEALRLLKEKVEGRGIIIEQLLVTDLGLPEKFKDAIERKLESQQLALQKEFELKQATIDADIEVARAKGAAQAQEIVRSTLSAEYLQYLWISTLNKNPNVIYVATEANMPVFRTQSSEISTK